MGVGPCVKTLPIWFPPNQLATKQAIWNLSHSIGAGGVFALLGWWIIPHFNAWRLCFLVPAGIAMAGSVGLLFAMKDSPEDVGLPPIPGRKVSVVKTKEESAAYNAVKAQTAKGYIKELSSPYPFMLPLNIISDSMFPVTLACRLFGNILAGVILMSLVYSGLQTASAALINVFANPDLSRE